jgi:hypothetical protein
MQFSTFHGCGRKQDSPDPNTVFLEAQNLALADFSIPVLTFQASPNRVRRNLPWPEELHT